MQRLIEAFYKKFWGDGKLNSKRAARALHKAVQSLANDKAIPLDQHIVFMHMHVVYDRHGVRSSTLIIKATV